MIYLKEGASALNLAYDDEIIQEANSTYQLSFKFPTNHFLCEKLVEETLLLADDLHGEQEFIIFEIEKHHGFISVYANQVATLLNNFSISELSVNNASGDRVFRSLVSSITREHPFTFFSDIASTHVINLKNMSVANALFKDKHSIMGQWGGDLVRDKYSIKLLSNGGNDKEAIFMYKKNLKGYQHKKSIKDLKTRIHFFKTLNSNKEGEEEKTIEVTVDSPLINKYQNIFEGNLEVNDQDVVDIKSLQEYGINYFKNTLCDVLEENIEIDVIGYSDVPINIFDTVSIFYENFNLDIKKKITSYKFSPMGKKLKSIGFGKIQGGLGATLSSMINEAVEQKVETSVDAFKIQKNLAGLLKKDRQAVEEKIKDLTEQAKAGVEVKRALFEEDGNVPDVFKTKVLDSVEADIARLKTIITEAEMIKAIQAQLDFGEIKTALIDKAFIKQILSDETFKQEFEEGEVTTQNIFAKMRDSIQSNIKKEFLTKDETRKLVTDLTIGADGIRQITQDESKKVFKNNVVAFKNDINNDIDSKIKSNDEKLRNEIGNSIGNIYDDLNKKNYELGQKTNKRINEELKRVDGDISNAKAEMNGKAEKLSSDINKSANGLRSELNNNINNKANKLKGDINSNASKIDVNIKKIELIERETKKFREFSSTIDEFKSKIGEIEKNKFEITTEGKNLCAETGETKHGNDLDFNTTETLKANKEYYILAEADGVKGSDQWTKIYNANMKQLDFPADGYKKDSKILVNGLNVWKVSYDHDVTRVNIWPCGSDTSISNVRIYEAVRHESKRNIYVSHEVEHIKYGSNDFHKVVFKVSEKLEKGEIYAIEFNSGVSFGYCIVNNNNVFQSTFIQNNAERMMGENGCYFENIEDNFDYNVTMIVSMSKDAELKLYGDVKIYKSNIKGESKNVFDSINEISSKIRQTKSEITSQVMEAKRNIDNTISEMSSQIRQTKSEIDLTVKKNDVISSINLSPEGVRIDASKVEITGSLHAYKGYIGGFEIGEKHGSQWFGGRNHNTGMYSGEYGHTLLWANWGNNWDNAKATAWYIDSTGSMYCGNNAKFNSYIEVEGGSFFKDDVHIGDSANIRYSNGVYLYSPVYNQLRRDQGYLHLIHQGSGEDWVQLWSDSSDRRYKRNIKPSKVKGLEVVNSLKTYSYTKEIKKYDIKKDIECGIMAQDVEKYAKDAFYKTPDDIYSYNPFELVPYLIKAIQELDTKVKKLDRLKLEEV